MDNLRAKTLAVAESILARLAKQQKLNRASRFERVEAPQGRWNAVVFIITPRVTGKTTFCEAWTQDYADTGLTLIDADEQPELEAANSLMETTHGEEWRGLKEAFNLRCKVFQTAYTMLYQHAPYGSIIFTSDVTPIKVAHHDECVITLPTNWLLALNSHARDLERSSSVLGYGLDESGRPYTVRNMINFSIRQKWSLAELAYKHSLATFNELHDAVAYAADLIHSNRGETLDGNFHSTTDNGDSSRRDHTSPRSVFTANSRKTETQA